MKITNREALLAQAALSKLAELDLPVKISLDIAIISNMIDERVKVFGKVRDGIFKKYSIKVSKGDTEDSVKFESKVEGDDAKRENLDAFGDKFSDLLDAKTDDLVFRKIKLPSDVSVKPDVLKPLVDFIEVE
jgi:hypothetical protein